MRVIIIVLLIFSSFTSFSQEEEKLEYPTYAIGYTPSALINFFNGVQISQDYGINSFLNLTLESGYIFQSLYSDYTQGFRLRPGLEMIMNAGKSSAFVVGMHYNYRRTISPRTISYIFETDEYVENVDVDRIKTLHGVLFSLGAVGKISDRMRIDFSMGVGVGIYDIYDINSSATRSIDNAFRFERSFYLVDSPTNEFFPLGSLNLNLSYTIVK